MIIFVTNFKGSLLILAYHRLRKEVCHYRYSSMFLFEELNDLSNIA